MATFCPTSLDLCNVLCDVVKESAVLALWAGISSGTLGAATAYLITGVSAVAAGALFGTAAALMFSTVAAVISFTANYLTNGALTTELDQMAFLIISLISAPVGGWAACAAAGFTLTALELTVLAVSSFAGGWLGPGLHRLLFRSET